MPAAFSGSPGMRRVSATVRRIVVNVVLALTNESNFVRRDRRLGAKGSFERRVSKLPKTDQYILGQAVKLNIDLRDELRKYLQSGRQGPRRGPVAVQTLVAGHGKWQVCGKARAGRKWITIEPYWRGPEDAPIVVRPHNLG